MHPVVEYCHKSLEASEEELGIGERRSRMLQTSERCRGLTCVEIMLSETTRRGENRASVFSYFEKMLFSP